MTAAIVELGLWNAQLGRRLQRGRVAALTPHVSRLLLSRADAVTLDRQNDERPLRGLYDRGNVQHVWGIPKIGRVEPGRLGERISRQQEPASASL